MSTFDGIVKEFPDIRIDYFRPHPSQHRPPPLAYFLSHVHSDHLTGLETCKSPFIYCSPATKEILLRLEKYPHRMNFAKGILETRKQTYRHLKNLLKPIPLDVPTRIELAPGRKVRVTLLEANHCVGAVMFLIEGEGRAVLYSGDVRAEGWWVGSLTRHPVLLPYVVRGKEGPLKRLDCVYLDTTFASKEDPYRVFPSKQEGLLELLGKVARYPKGTRFYFDSWTFGYEDVWQALSSFLGEQVHLDDYRLSLYRALANGTEPKAAEVAKLMGFHCGNHFQQGCLTGKQTLLHSCERGIGCEIWTQDFVRITPIISRHNGVDMAELGAGGGQNDLNQQHELEVGDAALVGQLIALCASKMQSQPQLLSAVLDMLTSIINGRVQSIALDASLFVDAVREAGEDDIEAVGVDELPLDKLVPSLAKPVAKTKQQQGQRKVDSAGPSQRSDGLPQRITFPYSRHSSYAELCHLIEAFKPKDIFPCTVDSANWTAASSMSFLFGHLYESNQTFSHDQTMLAKLHLWKDMSPTPAQPPSRPSLRKDDRRGSGDVDPKMLSKNIQHEKGRRDHYSPPRAFGKNCDHYSPPKKRKSSTGQLSLDGTGDKVPRRVSSADVPSEVLRRLDRCKAGSDHQVPIATSNQAQANAEGSPLQAQTCGSGQAPQQTPDNNNNVTQLEQQILEHEEDPVYLSDQPSTAPSEPLTPEARLAFRREAYDAALGNDDLQWSDVGLVSTGGHQVKEEEL